MGHQGQKLEDRLIDSQSHQTGAERSARPGLGAGGSLEQNPVALGKKVHA